ncbi:MAG: DUF5668 domain-containing protein [Chloroflexota bacterium]
MENRESVERRQRRRPRSIFWPLILIAVGVIFLLNNTGRMSGDLWANILQWWPLLLIVSGLDGFIRREGAAGSSLVLGLGVIFLLNNLGYFDLSVVGVLLHIWPLFLVAAGFDLLIGRRSWLLAIAGAVLIVAILAGTLFAMQASAGRRAAASESLRLSLEEAQQARILIEPGAGSLHVEAQPEPVDLVTGSYPAQGPLKMQAENSLQGGTAEVTLRGAGWGYAPGAAPSYDWDLKLPPQLPLDLSVDLGAGEMDLDLSGLTLKALKIDYGVAQATIRLPATGSFVAEINGAMGTLTLVVPAEVGLRVENDSGLSFLQLPEGYVQRTSPNYEQAEYRIELHLSQAMGVVLVQQP